ncbi:MAG TPA: ABC transporter ATP-binding protein [Lachnospiraceae bacterium]|nr:ABC transporter ATP-binding protein [Lachnospiraceae bacterium]HPF28475.1 ABC transporter ATP-binding protein [Lachnospiraceae bacterium]
MRAIGDILHKLNYIMNRKQKQQYVLVTAAAFVGSMWELLGVTTVLPFIESIMTPEKMTEKWYVNFLVRIFHPQSNLDMITMLGVLIICVYILKNIYLMFSSYVQAWYSTGVQRDLSIKMSNTFLHSSYLFHLNVNSAVLIRSINQDVVGVFAVFFYLFRILAEVFTIVAISVYIIYLDPILAISLVGILGSCMLILFFGLKKLVKRFGRIGQDCDGKMLQYLTQAFNGIKEIMVMNRQEYFQQSFSKSCTLSAKAAKRNNFLNVIPVNIYEVVCIGGLIGIVIIRLHMNVDVAEFITKLAIIAVAAFRLFPAVSRLTTNLNAIMYNRPRLDSMYDMLKTIECEDDYKLKDIDESKVIALKFENELSINKITWKYPSGQEAVLQDLSLCIQKGQSIALIGPSGAGKTTLADVILGLLNPQKGHILLDGVDVYDNLPGWSKIIGYVPQAVYLTDDNIRNNVAFGIYEDQIDEDKVWKALEEAQLADFVRHLEEGLNTMVGERGVRLSGGQRQRIAIARALYENPEILVLDEATSALDTETETAVMESIDSLHGSKTMIIVAHRLTTIRNCDAIYEIKDGVAIRRNKEEIVGENA